jgi:hypothetical protein
MVRQPALALDRCGSVIDTNRLALPFLGKDLHLRNQKLCLCDRRAAAALDTLIDQLRVSPDTHCRPSQSSCSARADVRW